MSADSVGTWLGVGVSVVGFAAALWQIRKTMNAVEASRRAVTRTERHLAVNHLLVMLPQLQFIESDFEAAIQIDHPESVRRSLTRWRHVTSEVLGILSRSGDSPEPLADLLRDSILLSTAASLSLFRGQRHNVAAVREARDAMGRAATAASEYVGVLRAYTGEDPV